MNIRFLEVQLHATFSEWRTIVALGDFASLCLARRSPAITGLLLEALYHTHLARSYDAHDVARTRAQYESQVRSFALPMMMAPATPSSFAWRIYGLEALHSPDRSDIRDLLVHRDKEIGWIYDLMQMSGNRGEIVATVETPLDAARGALIHVNEIESNNLLAEARAALSRLTPEERDLLRAADPFREPAQAAAEVESPPPTSWVEWLDRAPDPRFVGALDIARQGMDEWPIDENTSDPIAVQAIVAALNRAQESDVATERSRAGVALSRGVAPARSGFSAIGNGSCMRKPFDAVCSRQRPWHENLRLQSGAGPGAPRQRP